MGESQSIPEDAENWHAPSQSQEPYQPTEEEARSAAQFNQPESPQQKADREHSMALERGIARDYQKLRERDAQLKNGAPKSPEEEARDRAIISAAKLRDKIVPQVDAFMKKYLPYDNEDRRDLKYICQQIVDSVYSSMPNNNVLNWKNGAQAKMVEILRKSGVDPRQSSDWQINT
jgi:hypothetical protein